MQKPSYIPLIILIAVSVLGAFVPNLPTSINTEGLNSGDMAWMIVASAFVLLMTPGLAYFYGGMVNAKNVISTMFQSFVGMGVISVVWVVCGFSLAFGDSIKIGDFGFVGNPATFFMWQGVLDGKPWSLAPTIPLALFALFQLKFAVITPALVTGSMAERINFKSYVLFMILFSMFVYSPLAHMTWHPEGFLFKLGVLDFAGGTVVHMSAGWAALAGALYLKRRKSHLEANFLPPANIPFVLLGTALLWFGWFGFNAGSAVGASPLAVSAFATTNFAAAAAGLAWVLFDAAKGKKVSSLGFCIGAVVGLVAITPAAGFVTIPVSLFIGTVAGITSNYFAHLKAKGTLDDTLDVFPCHGIGGMVGMIMTGIFATKTVNSAVAIDGLAYGAFDTFKAHMIALVLVSAFAFTLSYALLWLTDKILPLRVTDEDERVGLDVSQHDEYLIEA
ncbi:ammonium transporter [Siphonobacter aquaeclarae]|jgi:Amt family ammonium transporter|uniref:Ammonium transporter n=1 Tax=Siphonobacter aquaeclarae TaxID=563176 RepID=A0A1G9RWS1_9BACT|nr:ammonium transporter [Siphonobacter aquaeclarae]MBO9638362.1 ammonium transporter [Siphonobacter aquaeclarae]SDM27622.1 ammonium transporter [Siphonobacter aquaeclarae]